MVTTAREQVIELISEFCLTDRSQFTVSSRLEDDLGITGDDGSDFIEAFAGKFQVDMTQFGKAGLYYFHCEGFDPITFIRKLRGWRDPRVLPITVGDLVRAVERGRWEDPPPAI